IPFRLDKKAAAEGLSKHLKGKRLLPKVFRDENHLKEVKGVYVPFWVFDADSDGTFRYNAEKVRRWEDANNIYEETSHYSVFRQAGMSFSGIPVNGSSKVASDLMESLEPYDLSQAVDFQTAYLAGFLADRYDCSEEDCAERAGERIRESTADAVRETVTGYDRVDEESGSVSISNGKAKYMLFPVWLLNTEWNGNLYTFAMNGQTGKFVGNLPLNRKAYAAWLIGLGLGIAAVVALLLFLLWK
ncbi:MAG: hypothetical protein ILO68_03710, partial [Clostridia bacterium]|nr:hypothetical protein [Clostridia bacterium]